MSLPADTISYTLELFGSLDRISTRNMMGGLCIYSDSQIFAILDRQGTIFLKAKGSFAETLALAGSRQFGSEDGGRMGYWTLPDDGLDDPETAADWGRQALANL
ncbi:MAG: TfoX/Sxy family protein [Paracoccaceae bacterium]